MNKLILLLLSLLIVTQSAFAAESAGTDPAWEHYITSQKKFQVAVHHLLRINHQEFRKTIDESQAYQLALADMKSMRFYDVLARTPESINLDGGFEGFVNFPWQESDEARLLETSQEFQNKAKLVKKLFAKIEKHPHYLQMQNRLFELQKDREYTEIMARFRFVSSDIDEMLATRRKKA